MRASMTKKHFKALADALWHARPTGHYDVSGWEAWEQCVEEVAARLRQFNPAFDHDRFVRACMEDRK